MPCPTLISPACKVGGTMASKAGEHAMHSGLDAMADTTQKSVSWLVRNTAAWWVHIDSVDLSTQAPIERLHTWFLPISLAVTVAGMIAAGLRMAVSRKAGPLLDVGGGLLTIAAAGALAITVPNLLLKAGDVWSDWVLQQATGQQFGTRMADLLSMTGNLNTGMVVILGVIALIMAAIQAILMLFRETAVLILVGVLPLAAAGALSPGTRSWIKRVGGWLLALIFYKPAAAAVYATAFALLGEGNGLRATLMGFCMFILSIIALPVLIKFFTFATGAVGQSGGGGLLGAATGSIVAVGALRGSGGGAGGDSAADQAGYTSGRLPSPGDSGGGDGPTGSGESPSSAPDGAGGQPTPSAGAQATSGAEAANGAGAGAAGGAATGGAAAGEAAAAGAGAAAGGPVGVVAAEAAMKLAGGAKDAASNAMDAKENES